MPESVKEPGRKGRPAGALSKPKQGLLARLRREFPNYHPVVELARIANDLENDVTTRKDAHKEVAKYVTPQLKAVDISSGGAPLVFNFSITPGVTALPHTPGQQLQPPPLVDIVTDAIVQDDEDEEDDR